MSMIYIVAPESGDQEMPNEAGSGVFYVLPFPVNSQKKAETHIQAWYKLDPW